MQMIAAGTADKKEKIMVSALNNWKNIVDICGVI
jgi:hypothetical protein